MEKNGKKEKEEEKEEKEIIIDYKYFIGNLHIHFKYNPSKKKNQMLKIVENVSVHVFFFKVENYYIRRDTANL